MKQIAESKGVPHLNEMVDGLITEFGGIRQFCKIYREEFLSAKQGSLTRSRMLDHLLRLVALARSDAKPGENDLADETDLMNAAQDVIADAEGD